LSKVLLAVPPASTTWVPPLTVVATAMPLTRYVPPLTVVALALPPAQTICDPAKTLPPLA